ncbi:MAG: Na+/H+ antiporter subunit E [Bacteroidales bacterium]|nr:Na+/H+ antiporter subunit E [Bacteroidales bacterium]
MKIKALIVIFSILMAVWLILNQSADIECLAIGAVSSLLLAFMFCRGCTVFNDINLTPKACVYSFMFLAVFMFELVKSNFDIARRVLSPSLPINPGIIKAKTNLKSRMARLILANSITLTPGTFTIDIIDDTLYIHCVHIDDADSEKFGKEIIRKFEKYLEVLYG